MTVSHLSRQGERGMWSSRGEGSAHRPSRSGRHLLRKLQNHSGVEICKKTLTTHGKLKGIYIKLTSHHNTGHLHVKREAVEDGYATKL